jgi:opacity protein-like surface antigen
MKAGLATLGALALVIATAAGSGAEDSERLRYYLHLRAWDTNPATGVHDHWGLSLGANLGRYWGVELAVDTFERIVEVNERNNGEYGVAAFVPQLRLRYPFLDNRLVPYVVGGVGFAVTEFNDRKEPAFGVAVRDGSSVLPVGTLGAGLEYYFADNLAVGFEVKYLFAPDQTITIGGTRHTQEVQSLFTSIGLRLLAPELRPQPLAEARDVVPTRLYLGLRYGTALLLDTSEFSGIEVRPEPSAFFSEGNQFYGAAIGLNFGRYLGVELAAEGYEGTLEVPGAGSVSEVGVAFIIPYLRLRYPLWEGRVVPYFLAGVGLSTVRSNDTKAPGVAVDVDAESYSWGAGIGAGVEYFVASNIALGVEARYLTARGHTARINNGPELDGHVDAVAVALTLRIFLASFGPPATSPAGKPGRPRAAPAEARRPPGYNR